MAYVSPEKKKELAPAIKAIMKKYGVKGSIAVRHYSELVVNIKSGVIDFASNNIEALEEDNRVNHYDVFKHKIPAHDKWYDDVNEYHFEKRYSGVALKFIEEMIDAMKGPGYFNHDNSMIDYFNRSHYVSLNLGKWDKPYIYEGAK